MQAEPAPTPDPHAPAPQPAQPSGTQPAQRSGTQPAQRSGTQPANDWASETADRLDQLIATIRSQTTDRLVKISRIVVFGLLGAILAVVAVVLLVITLVRVLDTVIPQEVWLAYLVLGAILIAAGLLAWSKRQSRPARA